MASRQRIHLMMNLVEAKNLNSVNCSLEEQQTSKYNEIERFNYKTSKPGCSKHSDLECSPQNNNLNDCVSDMLNISPAKSNQENNIDSDSISDIFTDHDETFLVCLDILSTLIDCLPCFEADHSNSSSDEYIPDSLASSDSEDNIRRRRKNNRPNIVINESDSEEKNVSFWQKEGIKEGRKRKPRKSEKERRIDRENRKKMRNTGKGYVTKKGKNIRARSFIALEACRMKCAENIPVEFRKRIFETYWGLGEYNQRVQFISRLIEIKNKKTCKLVTTRNSNRQYANKYYLKLNAENYIICKGCFLKTFNETPKFVQLVANRLKSEDGNISTTTRGNKPSAATISEERLELVKQHILSFPAYESHYGRSKTEKKFLPPHLCLKDMFDAYCKDTENPVSLTIYSWVFKAQNLSFKKPYLDTCVKCDTFEMKVKYSEGEEQLMYKKQKKDHQEKAEAVYDRKASDRQLSIEKTDTYVCAFDLQQCLPTPYLKSGAAFYKRPLWTYNFTIRNCTTNKVYCFMWHESIGGRGANQMASCVYYFILNYIPSNIKHLIFYSDSCSGQNKNFHMVNMFLLAARNNPNVETIIHNFFVPGHTHMDCDTDHAAIEKAKKKTRMEIHHPRDWYQLARTCNKKNAFTVIEMHADLFLDFASLLKGPFQQKKINEDKQKFNISETAIFMYNKAEFAKFKYKTYENDDQWYTVCLLRKRGKSPLPSVFDTESIPRCYDGPLPISKEKKRDLMSLLPLINPSVKRFYEELICNDDTIDTHPLIPTEDSLD